MRTIHKTLGISLLVHLAVIASLTIVSFIVPKKRHRPAYQVSLVTQPEPKQETPAVQAEEEKPPPKKQAVVEKTPAPVKKKEVKEKVEKPLKKEPKRQVKKEPKPEMKKQVKKPPIAEKKTEKASLDRVQARINEIKKKMAAQQRSKQERLAATRVVEAKRHAYFDAVAAHVQANWSLLKNQMEDVGVLTTDVGLQVRRDGAITSVVIEKPSGNPLFDEFALRAVKRSDPLPPFPEELGEGKLDITIGLSS